MNKLAVVLVVSLAVLLPVPAQAFNLIKGAVGILTDPLKIGHASENVLKSVDQMGAIADRINTYLSDLQGKTDEDITRYIGEINLIIDKLNVDVKANIGAADTLVQNALTSITELEGKIFKDSLRLVECAEAVTKRNIKEVLAEAINSVERAKPCFKIFDWCLISFSVNRDDINNPIEEYNRLMAAYRSMLSDVKEGDSALLIPSTLAEMQRVTLEVVCLYDDTSIKPDLMKAYANLRVEAEPWVGYADFSMKNYIK